MIAPSTLSFVIIIIIIIITEAIDGPDIARGEGLEESSSEDEDIEDDEAANQTTGIKLFYHVLHYLACIASAMGSVSIVRRFD